MTAPRVELAHGLALVGRPSGNVQAEVAFAHGGHRLDQDVVDLRRAGVRDTVAERFVRVAVQGGFLPGVVPEPHGRAFRFQDREPSDAEVARAAAVGGLKESVSSALLALADLVEVERAQQAEAAAAAADGDAQGHAITLNNPEPWPDEVDGTALLNELRDLFLRYLALPPGAAELMALWVAHTYVYDRFDHSGYLAIVSPQRRSGKTTALTVLASVAARPLAAGNVSPAGIYRVIEQAKPTLFVDELDRVHRDSDLWTVLNAGHSRGTPVLRVVGEQQEPRAFATYGPKLMAYIRGQRCPVADTVEDRTIRVVIQRQPRDARKPKVRSNILRAEAMSLRSKLARWVADVELALPHIPDELDDRAADSWEPLLAIANAAGGDWPARAAELAVRFSADRGDEESENSIGALLLADLATLIQEDRLDLLAGLSGEEAVRELATLPDRPWATWGHSGRPITVHAFGRILRAYGITSERVGPTAARVRRYPAAAVHDAIGRYVVSGMEGGATKRSSGHPSESVGVSDSKQTVDHMTASEADTEGVSRGHEPDTGEDGQGDLPLELPDDPDGEVAL